MKALLYKVPADQEQAGGLFIGGGWHKHIQHKEHGVVLAVPSAGDYSCLQGMGYVPVGTTTLPPDAPDAAKEVLASPAPVRK